MGPFQLYGSGTFAALPEMAPTIWTGESSIEFQKQHETDDQ
jgi:hypothetical protein